MLRLGELVDKTASALEQSIKSHNGSFSTVKGLTSYANIEGLPERLTKDLSAYLKKTGFGNVEQEGSYLTFRAKEPRNFNSLLNATDAYLRGA